MEAPPSMGVQTRMCRDPVKKVSGWPRPWGPGVNGMFPAYSYQVTRGWLEDAWTGTDEVHKVRGTDWPKGVPG